MTEDLAARYKDQRKKIRTELEAFYLEVEQGSAAVVAEPNLTPQICTAYIDRWNAIRSDVFRFSWKIQRWLAEAKFEFDDGMRKHMDRGPSGKLATLAFGEREASYQTKNLVAWNVLRVLEPLSEELRAVSFQMDSKIRWLEGKRRALHKADDDFRYSSNKDFQG